MNGLNFPGYSVVSLILPKGTLFAD